MTANPIAKKLGMKPGMQALIVAAPTGYLELLSPLPEGLAVSSTPHGLHSFVQIFATALSGIDKAAAVLSKHAAPKAVVWIAYPKQTSGMTSDLNRDRIRERMSEMGWRTVSIVAIDKIWSALRFLPDEDIQ